MDTVDLLVGLLVFGGFAGSLLAVTVGMVTFGRRRGYGDFDAPDLERRRAVVDVPQARRDVHLGAGRDDVHRRVR